MFADDRLTGERRVGNDTQTSRGLDAIRSFEIIIPSYFCNPLTVMLVTVTV